MATRGSQRYEQTRVFSFKLSSDRPDEAAVRERLETLVDEHGLSLREVIVDLVQHGEIVVERYVSADGIEDVIGALREELLADIRAALQQMPASDLRGYADARDNEDEIGGAKLSDDFINNMLKGFNRG